MLLLWFVEGVISGNRRTVKRISGWRGWPQRNHSGASKTTVRAAVNSAVFIPERLIVTPQKWA